MLPEKDDPASTGSKKTEMAGLAACSGMFSAESRKETTLPSVRLAARNLLQATMKGQ